MPNVGVWRFSLFFVTINSVVILDYTISILGDNNMDIKISVLCTAYNHEKYIRQCLEGFVMQKTEVPFEVIIHDDASTDGTIDIIREYEEKYPEIIKPIYQGENQYSKNVDIISKILLPIAEGEYIALCEGDDFWCDPYKLQKQYNAMKNNLECHMCVHTVNWISESGVMLKKTWPEYIVDTGVIDSLDFLKLGYFQTNSYFLRKKDYLLYAKKSPQFVKTIFESKVGDQALLLYFANLGPVYYFSDAMSCYRTNSIGSWTSRHNNNIKQKILHFKTMEKALNEFNEYSNYKFLDIINERIKKYRFWTAQYEENYLELVKKEYREMFLALSMKYKIKILVGVLCPTLIKKISKKKCK